MAGAVFAQGAPLERCLHGPSCACNPVSGVPPFAKRRASSNKQRLKPQACGSGERRALARRDAANAPPACRAPPAAARSPQTPRPAAANGAEGARRVCAWAPTHASTLGTRTRAHTHTHTQCPQSAGRRRAHAHARTQAPARKQAQAGARRRGRAGACTQAGARRQTRARPRPPTQALSR